MMIPDEAVDAAARALDPQTMGSGGPLAEKLKGQARAEARRALEAAAPFLMARAWDEGDHAGYLTAMSESHGLSSEPPIRNPYRTS